MPFSKYHANGANEQTAEVPFVPCPSCLGWLISSYHRERFDWTSQEWHFTCPDCGGRFDVPDSKIAIRSIGLKAIRDRYPQFRTQDGFCPKVRPGPEPTPDASS